MKKMIILSFIIAGWSSYGIENAETLPFLEIQHVCENDAIMKDNRPEKWKGRFVLRSC